MGRPPPPIFHVFSHPSTVRASSQCPLKWRAAGASTASPSARCPTCLGAVCRSRLRGKKNRRQKAEERRQKQRALKTDFDGESARARARVRVLCRRGSRTHNSTHPMRMRGPEEAEQSRPAGARFQKLFSREERNCGRRRTGIAFPRANRTLRRRPGFRNIEASETRPMGIKEQGGRWGCPIHAILQNHGAIRMQTMRLVGR